MLHAAGDCYIAQAKRNADFVFIFTDSHTLAHIHSRNAPGLLMDNVMLVDNICVLGVNLGKVCDLWGETGKCLEAAPLRQPRSLAFSHTQPRQ